MGKKDKNSLEYLMKRDKANAPLARARTKQMKEVEELREKVLDMRLQNMSYRAIAEKLKTKHSFDYLRTLAEHKYEARLHSNSMKAAMVRDQSDAQLQEIISRWMGLALSEDLNVGEKRLNKSTGEEYDVSLEAWEASATATDKVLKAIDQRARIHGLNLTKIELKDDPITQQLLYEAVNTGRQIAQKLLENKQKVIQAEVIEQ